MSHLFSKGHKLGNSLGINPWQVSNLLDDGDLCHSARALTIRPADNLIYTDGSLSGSKAATAVVLGDEAFTLRLPDKSSMFTAEMYALLIAFQQIEKKHQETFYYFFGFKISFTSPSV